MSEYLDLIRRHRRLAILRHLEGCAEYTSNAAILGDVLAGLGLGATHDQIVTEAMWLRDQGLVRVADDGFCVIAATRAGAEIARGVTTHPDIQRPRPGG